MAENDEAKQVPDQEQAEPKKKKKKPNFSKPFIISGILLGVFAGAPFLNLGNYVFGLWGWVFGLLAAWFLSKEYKYFLVAHGGMVGFFTGLIGSGIAMVIDIGVCFAGFSTFTLLPSLEKPLSKVAGILSFWIPARWHVDAVKDNAVILPPWETIKEATRILIVQDRPAISPSMKLTGHALFIVPLLAGTAILGGVIGWKLFAKEPPKKQLAAPKRRRRPPAAGEPPAGEPAPQQPAQTGAPTESESEGEPAQSPEPAQEKPAQPEGQPEKTDQEPGSYEYGSSVPDSPKEERKEPENTGEEKED